MKFLKILKKKAVLIYSRYRYFIRYVLCKYFLPVCGSSFHSLNVFWKAEMFNFDEVKFMNLFFLDCPFDVISKKSSPNPRSQRFSRSFIVLDYMFRSLIYFELIFVCGGRYGSRLILLGMDIQLFQHHLLKRLPFLHCIAFRFFKN